MQSQSKDSEQSQGVLKNTIVLLNNSNLRGEYRDQNKPITDRPKSKNDNLALLQTLISRVEKLEKQLS